MARAIAHTAAGTSEPVVEAAAAAKGMTLVLGKGNDPDTLGTKQIFVYDTGTFKIVLFSYLESNYLKIHFRFSSTLILLHKLRC